MLKPQPMLALCPGLRTALRTLAVSAFLAVLWPLGPIHAGEPTIELYVDEAGRVFTQPGANRSKLGTFQKVDPATPPAAAAGAVPMTVEPAAQQASAPAAASDDKSVTDALASVLKTKWYEKISLRGYTQFRYTGLFEKDGPGEWVVPTDRSVNPDSTFLIRRARMIFSGDVTDHLYIYIQPDLNAAPTDGDFSVQLRDAYADIAIDKDKEFRIRAGQSKVPYGFVNMQSSQNRAAMERPDSLNSAVEGERDIGIFAYWAPKEIRTLFRDINKNGLKGSGDYGVLGLGIYSGQGLNRLDSNDDVHVVVRASYPFQFANGQIFEPGIQGYTGKFVPRTRGFTSGDTTVTPTFSSNGLRDQRMAFTAVLYPQPFGIEAEWTFGEGPELAADGQRIEVESLQGGYIQTSYKMDSPYGTIFPFVRWQYYEGGRKFARNAPKVKVDEVDFGVEWSPWPEVEIMAMYTFTPKRTDSSTYPYTNFTDASRLGLQLQWNY